MQLGCWEWTAIGSVDVDEKMEKAVMTREPAHVAERIFDEGIAQAGRARPLEGTIAVGRRIAPMTPR